MHTVNLNEARMRVITIKAHSEGLNRMLEVARGPSTFPITITTLAKRPKKRRHAHGGLRRLIASRIHKYTAHDAIRAIMLAPVEVGGGGCTFCSVEYNPGDDNPDANGNLPHSVRVIIGGRP